MIIDLDLVSWQFCFIMLFTVLFFIYLFFGGGDYEYIGLAPLEIGYDASQNCKHEDGENIEENDIRTSVSEANLTEDNTPVLPELDKIKAPPKKSVYANRFSSRSYSSNMSLETSTVESYTESTIEGETTEEAMTPRTAGLGPYNCRVNGFISKGERLCKQAIEEIYGKPFFCIRPDFLKNPETGRNLEIDIYNDELKIGVEYSGKAHFVFPNAFHKTHEEFINQVRRDQFKVDMCDANGIYLITVPYNVPLNLEDIKKYITYYLPENVEKRGG